MVATMDTNYLHSINAQVNCCCLFFLFVLCLLFISTISLFTDINECLTLRCTGDHQYCENTLGSYTCDCVFGYKKNLTTNLCEGTSYIPFA